MSDSLWQESVGEGRARVTVVEMATRNGTLYLRWRAKNNWKWASLGRRLVNEAGERLRGRALDTAKRWAREQAAERSARLLLNVGADAAPAAPLTLGETWAVLSDRATGAYPVDTPTRRAVRVTITHAIRILPQGAATVWDAIGDTELTRIWRTRIDEIRAKGLRGCSGAEQDVGRLLAVANALRDAKRIGAGACRAPRKWKQRLAADWRKLAGATRDYEPERPRYTAEEARRLLAAAATVDPRYGLVLALGLELRHEQVARTRRSDLRLTDGAHGVVRIHGQGKKGGETIALTRGQRAAVDAALDLGTGVLGALEAAYGAGALPDYPMVPGGRLVAGRASVAAHGAAAVIGHRSLHRWRIQAEEVAGIPRVAGRGGRGARRAGVDAAKSAGISREGLQRFGGWADAAVPDAIYADQDAVYSRDEARDIRAVTRGETAE